MSRPVTINIPHKLGKVEARHRIEDGFRESAESWKTLLRKLKEGVCKKGRGLLWAMGRSVFGQ